MFDQVLKTPRQLRYLHHYWLESSAASPSRIRAQCNAYLYVHGCSLRLLVSTVTNLKDSGDLGCSGTSVCSALQISCHRSWSAENMRTAPASLIAYGERKGPWNFDGKFWKERSEGNLMEIYNLCKSIQNQPKTQKKTGTLMALYFHSGDHAYNRPRITQHFLQKSSTPNTSNLVQRQGAGCPNQ